MAQSSCWSRSTAPTRRMTEASSGKIPTTLERRLISLLIRSSGFVDAILRQCARGNRSEEHTSELQSLMRISYAVFCLKKKNTQEQHEQQYQTLSQHHINKTLPT